MDDQFIVVRGIGYGLYKTRILRADILFRDLFQCLKPTFSKKIMYAGLAVSVAVSALLILLAGVYTGLYRVDGSVKEIGKILLIVSACSVCI